MFKYNLTSKPKFNVEKKTIDSIFFVISNIIETIQLGTINLVFLDDDSIKKLNKTYRKVDKSTDVLSFHYFDNFDKLGENEIAGEIIMSENKIVLQAKEYSLGNEKEFYKLLIHSILHILGYDHEKENDYQKMQNLENQIWEEVFEK